MLSEGKGIHRVQLLVVVVAYEAAAFIERLLDRIPDEVAGLVPTVLVADDASTDDTVDRAEAWAAAHPDRRVVVLRRPTNLGYGGNQRACYAWAATEGYDLVALVHGDEQYPPERLGLLVEPLMAAEGRAVFGSRMIEPGAARRGGMPLDRYLGNRVLSWWLNRCNGTDLSEWFSGFRAYRVDTLQEAALDDLPPGFDFDTAIMMRLLSQGVEILEVPMPTRYADEISRVPLVRTGVAALRGGIRNGVALGGRRGGTRR